MASKHLRSLLFGMSRENLPLVLIVAVTCGLAFLAKGSVTQYIANGLVAGSMYGLTALGFTLVFRTVKYFDLAYSVYPSIGGFAVLRLASTSGEMDAVLGVLAVVAGPLALLALVFRSKLPVVLSNADNLSIRTGVTGLLALVAVSITAFAIDPTAYLLVGVVTGMIVSGGVSVAVFKLVYDPLHSASRSPLAMIVSSLGMMLVLQSVLALIFSVRPQIMPILAFDSTIFFFGAAMRASHILQLSVSLLVFALVFFLFMGTNFGRAARAVGDDEGVSAITGIDTKQVIAVLFFLSGAIAALVGVMAAFDLGAVQPRLGFLPLFKGWIASVIGGIGSIPGAMIGGLALGLLENMATGVVPAEWKDSVAFVVFISFLLLRPQGIVKR